MLDGKCLRDKCQADHEPGYELLKRVASDQGQALDATRLRLLDIYSSPTWGQRSRSLARHEVQYRLRLRARVWLLCGRLPAARLVAPGPTTTEADLIGQDAEGIPAASSNSFSAGSTESASSSMSLAISGVVTKPKSTDPW